MWIIWLILGIWMVILTYLFLKSLGNYNRLTKNVSEKTLSEVLSEFLEQSKATQLELNTVRSEIAKVKKDGLKNIQKMGLVRFNPFADTGGDQSFTLALLDGNDDGMILTSLYSRNTMRWYVKTVHRSKGVEHDLSKEEQEAVKKAARMK